MLCFALISYTRKRVITSFPPSEVSRRFIAFWYTVVWIVATVIGLVPNIVSTAKLASGMYCRIDLSSVNVVVLYLIFFLSTVTYVGYAYFSIWKTLTEINRDQTNPWIVERSLRVQKQMFHTVRAQSNIRMHAHTYILYFRFL